MAKSKVYSVSQFADLMKVSTANIYNSLNGYKNQKFVKGWFAYRTETSEWMISRAEVDNNGAYRVPANIKRKAQQYVLGAGQKRTGKALNGLCEIFNCQNTTIARRLCWKHYAQQRRQLS